MKSLNGSDLGGFIKQRQAGSVQSFIQNHKFAPKLAIIRTNPDPVVDSYMRLKQDYGSDIGVEVDVHSINQGEALELIAVLNDDPSIHGIIVQIPLPDITQTDEILNAVVSNKDVDGLAEKSEFDPATPLAINWLLSGYNIDLKDKKILIIGQGRLVGKPLAKLWERSNLQVKTADKSTKDLPKLTKEADLIVSAAGVPSLLKKDMVNSKVIIVDAGVATDSNGLVGDVDSSIREIKDITITPIKGGVGPLTVCALFENVIISAQRSAKQSQILH